MEILKCTACLALFTWVTCWAGTPITDVKLIPGLSAEVIYDVADPAPGGIGRPTWDMDVDPLTGNLVIGQSTEAGGNILMLDPETGATSTIPFFSQAIGFADDGTMYFGVSNLMLGTWERTNNRFRKFAIIPSVRGVHVNNAGELFVAEGDFGPKGLYPDMVLKVDRGDGFFEPIFNTLDAEATLEQAFDVITTMSTDNLGNIYVGYHTGELVKLKPDGTYVNLNERPGRIGGLNEAPISIDSNNIVYQYDISTGQLFAIFPDESVRLVAYGKTLSGSKFSNGGITTQGHHIYLSNDSQTIIRLSTLDQRSISDLLADTPGTGKVSGKVLNLFTQAPVEGSTLKLHNGQTTTSAADGSFSFDVDAGLYEMSITRDEFRTQYVNFKVDANGETTANINLNPGLPETLAPGLVAEIIADKNDSVSGSSDVWVDVEGNLWSMNYAAGNITKHMLDPETRAPTSSMLFAEGGKLTNSFILAVDEALNVYAASGNDGVVKLPPRTDGVPYQLEVDANDNTIVRDQSGTQRLISKVSDVDGITLMNNGDLMFSSGTSGSPTPGFPGGTFNTLVRHRGEGNEEIYSRGIPASGGDPLFNNNDIIKTDPQDRVLAGTRTGDVIRVDTDGTATLIWPGNDTADGAGAFSCLNTDGAQLYIRGDKGDGTDSTLRMIAPDGNSLVDVAGGLSQCFGGFTFDDQGRSVIISDDNLIIRIKSLDGRTITENLLNPPPKKPVKLKRFIEPTVRVIPMPQVVVGRAQ